MPSFQTVVNVALIWLFMLAVAAPLAALRYRRSYGEWPDRDAAFVLFKIFLAISVVGGVFGYLIGKEWPP